MLFIFERRREKPSCYQTQACSLALRLGCFQQSLLGSRFAVSDLWLSHGRVAMRESVPANSSRGFSPTGADSPSGTHPADTPTPSVILQHSLTQHDSVCLCAYLMPFDISQTRLCIAGKTPKSQDSYTSILAIPNHEAQPRLRRAQAAAGAGVVDDIMAGSSLSFGKQKQF
jgi:hypothetical protein